MATIESRKARHGRVTYRARVRILGHPERCASFDRKTDAKDWAAQIESDLKRGRYVPTTEAMRRTVAQMIDRYIDEALPFRPRNKDRRGMVARLRWWKLRIGDYALANITPGIITDAKLDLAKGGRAASTVNHYLSVLSAAFKTAVKEWHWIDASPMAGVAKIAEPRGRVRFLSEDERKALLEACAKNHDLYTVVVLALSTGARRGEILGLRWPHVDLNRCVITLCDTKNGERRVLPLAGPALELMRERCKLRAINDDRVFPNANKQGAEMNIRRTWAEAVAVAKLDDFRFHDLRHSAASYLAMNGATLAELAEILGHKTLAMVKRYAHLTEQHTARVVARMNAAIFGGDR